MRKWRIMDGIKRCVITHEGHTVMCATPTDARIVMESVNSLIEAMENGAATRRMSSQLEHPVPLWDIPYTSLEKGIA